MPYTPNTPNANDRISDTQNPILQNFQTLGAIAGNTNTNSALLNASAGFDLVYVQNRGAQPTFVAGTTNIWTQTNNIASLGNTGQNELFIRTDTANTGANQGIPITSASKVANGWSWLPSGILIQWGTAATVPGGGTVNFPITFPTACLSVQLTTFNAAVADSNTFVRLRGFSTTQARVYSTQRTTTSDAAANVHFFAIGH